MNKMSDFTGNHGYGSKEANPNTKSAEQLAQEITDSIVTKTRVEKMIRKLQDEGILPEKIKPADMSIVSQYLPQKVYENCLEEESEAVKAAGEYFAKQSPYATMAFAKELLINRQAVRLFDEIMETTHKELSVAIDKLSYEECKKIKNSIDIFNI